MGFEKFSFEKIFKKESINSHVPETGDPFVDVYKLLKLNNAFSQIETKPELLKKEKAPIGPDEVFDPRQEMSKLLHWDQRLKGIEPESQVSKRLLENERLRKKEALARFKEKLVYQQKGLSYLESSVLQNLYQNPEWSKKDLISFAQKFEKDYHLGLSEEQFSKIETLIGEYYEAHRQISNLFNNYPSAEGLFNYFFDQPPRDKIFICFSPLSLAFVCASADDFRITAQKAGYEGQLLDRAVQTFTGFCPDEIAGKSKVPLILINGWRIKKGLVRSKEKRVKENGEEQKIVVTKEELYNLKSPFWQFIAQVVYPHEERHILDKLFIRAEIKSKLEEALRQKNKDKLESLKLETDKLVSELEIEREFSKYLKDFEASGKKEIFDGYFRWRLPSILEEAKSELLAYAQESPANLHDPLEKDKLSLQLSLSEEEGGLYDFLVIEKSVLSSLITRDAEKANKVFNLLTDWAKTYEHDIRQGLESFYQLTSELKYPPSVAAALLRPLPLPLWPKTVSRIKEIEKPLMKKSK